ncbi:MAG TPA: hypothetical protein VEA40_00475 [Ramlibacter sp.]|nr:hypothetical protein [Ramlibacter sp.]
MQATGLFFLRMNPSRRVTPAGEFVGIELPVVERDPRDPKVYLNTLTARWPGPEAEKFYSQHEAELKPGRPLNLTLDRLRGDPVYGWVATVSHCELAPLPRRQQQNTDSQPAAPATT